jgi:hypothetical protein
MIDIWMAANHTKSDVLMVWWYPEKLYQTFVGTDAEFLKVTLPTATQECVDAHITIQERCSSDFKTRVGAAAGACDEVPKQLYKVVSTSLYDMTFDPKIPTALRSPAHQAVVSFSMTSTQLADIFNYWLNATDSREGICNWLLDNMHWASEFVPETYPRRVTMKNEWSVLRWIALVLSILTITLTLYSLATVYRKRKRRVMVFAQVEFLLLILAGLVIVSLAAIVTAIPPTNGSCVAAIWFIYAGYTLELVPLCTKVSAVNRLMHASASMKRFVVQRKSLFGAVAAISTLVVVFLLTWTIKDPPQRLAAYDLTSAMSINNETLIEPQFYCSSDRAYWTYIGLTWNSILLVGGTVLAFQTRDIRQEFNESQTMALMIYSHFVFVLMRVISFIFLPRVVNESTLALCQSIIFSVDTLATLAIYFLPKFLTSDEVHRRSSSNKQASRSSWLFTRSELEKYQVRGPNGEDSVCLEFSPADDGKASNSSDEEYKASSEDGLRHRHVCQTCNGSGEDPNYKESAEEGLASVHHQMMYTSQASEGPIASDEPSARDHLHEVVDEEAAPVP